MPVGNIKEYCKSNNIPLTSVVCTPQYDDKKGRITKGSTICNVGWNKKSRYNEKHVTETPSSADIIPTMWMMNLESARMFVIDIDVKDGKKARDVMNPESYNNHYNSSDYIIETGSGGLHFYYKLPEDFKGIPKNFTKIPTNYFKEGEKGDVDIIMKAIITEGSTYSYEDQSYSYTAIKGSIEEVNEFSAFDVFYNQLTTEIAMPTSNALIDSEVNKQEVIDHLKNIPNDANWDNWQRMAQLVFNILGSNEYDVFQEWSSKNPIHNEREAIKLWRGLKPLTDGDKKPLSIRSLYYLSEKANADEYYKIRNKYSDSESFWNLIKLPTHYDSAKFFHNYKPYAYIYKTDWGWYSLLKNNTWSYSKEKPGYLINDIAQTFKELCNRKKNEIDLNSDSDAEKAKLKQLVKFNSLSGTLSFCEAIGKFLQNFYLDEDITIKMDGKMNLFAFSDKVYDLDTAIVRDIDPTDYISIHTGYPYPKERYPEENKKIMDFLWAIFEDNELIEFEMNKMAYALHGEKKLEKFVIETGDGRNGKGTKSKLIQSAFGNYFQTLPITVLTKPNERKDAPNPGLVPCRGKRYVEASEPDGKDRLQASFIKEVTGLDLITCRDLFGKNIQFMFQGLLSIQTNGVPKWNVIDAAINDRGIIQPFPFMFVDENVTVMEDHHRRGNPDLKKSLSTTKVRDEYIMMLLDRYDTFKNKKSLHLPKVVKDRTNQNRDDNIPIKEWADENVEKGKEQLDNKIVWARYTSDMGSSGVSPVNFATQMMILGYTKKRTNSGIVWTNVTLKEKKCNIRQ